MPESPRVLTDLEALRALANPRRMRIRQHLELHGPATSAILARALDLNTGATSYNLRELARYGFVEDIPERARGRERWWRAVEVDLRFLPLTRQSPEMRAVFEEMNRLAVAADLELFARSQLQRDNTDEWADTLRYSRGSIQITAADFDAFFEDYIELLTRYARPPRNSTAPTHTILTRFLTFPAPQPDDD